jgi:ABC-type sulfate transport system permease component
MSNNGKVATAASTLLAIGILLQIPATIPQIITGVALVILVGCLCVFCEKMSH